MTIILPTVSFAVSFALVTLFLHLRDRHLRARVFESMENARVNGYEQRFCSANAIAEDINRCDADLERVNPDRLLPHIREWQHLNSENPPS